MSDDRYVSTPTGAVDADGQRQRFTAFLALALGILGALGGGVVGTAVQWLSFSVAQTSYPDGIFAVLMGGVPVIFGVVAIVLGMQASAARDPLDAPIGRVGATLGAVAVVGGVLYVVALLLER
ncbi:hypothetical protein [Nocardioides sp. LHG3406-4]|uniref:hypothetical protein n=1 Tax=Nocardioides sp. LHG3406-4 TaxID=2804575 RepID=UPI003CF0FCED